MTGELNSPDPTLTLPQREIDRKLDDEISTRVDKIKKEVGETDWEKLNDGQKAAVLDIHYANGSLEKFPDLKKEIKNGDANGIAREVGFHSGEKPDGTKVRNWEREARNQAAVLGISQEEGRRAVIEKYKGTGESPTSVMPRSHPRNLSPKVEVTSRTRIPNHHRSRRLHRSPSQHPHPCRNRLSRPRLPHPHKNRSLLLNLIRRSLSRLPIPEQLP